MHWQKLPILQRGQREDKLEAFQYIPTINQSALLNTTSTWFLEVSKSTPCMVSVLFCFWQDHGWCTSGG